MEIVFGKDNTDNIRMVLDEYKNVLVCGIKGVGKITHAITAVRDHPCVYYLGNPVDHEGKLRPGSYEKYLNYIMTLKPDIRIIDTIAPLFSETDDVVVVIDEMVERSKAELADIELLLDMPNIRIVQIVGCLRSMNSLIAKISIILQLHHDGAFVIDRDFGVAMCSILARQGQH